MFKPIALLAYLAATVVLSVAFKLAAGEASYLTTTDLYMLAGAVIGWFWHWTVTV